MPGLVPGIHVLGFSRNPHPVMPGFMPGIYVYFVPRLKQDVDGRDKPGHDGTEGAEALAFLTFWPQIRAGRLAVDEPLANRVRSGRKQP
jgi:hypothetical protein